MHASFALVGSVYWSENPNSIYKKTEFSVYWINVGAIDTIRNDDF